MAGLVKHYQNTMKGIPQLTNNWGAMINLLDAVLVNGFNHVTILGITKANTTSITATINLGSDHGFIDRQVVRIAGSTNGWDGDYKVLSADGATITVECTAEHPSAISGTVTCFTAPLDFEVVYQTPVESIEPKRAYRSTDPESLGLILLVHDFCVSGAAATGAKFAKVGIVDDMSDIDTIIGNQMPFDATNPNANWGWDGTHHGWAKWYYKTANHSGDEWIGVHDQQVPPGNNSVFYIASDGISVAVNVKISNWDSYSSYGFFEFDDVRYVGKNLCLLAFGVQQRMRQLASLYAEARSGLVIKELATEISGSNKVALNAQVWNNGSAIYAQELAGSTPYFVLPTENTNNYRPRNINTNKHILSDVVLTNGTGDVIGVLPFFKFTTRRENAVIFDTNLGKLLSCYRTSNLGSAIKNIMLLERK